MKRCCDTQDQDSSDNKKSCLKPIGNVTIDHEHISLGRSNSTEVIIENSGAGKQESSTNDNIKVMCKNHGTSNQDSSTDDNSKSDSASTQAVNTALDVALSVRSSEIGHGTATSLSASNTEVKGNDKGIANQDNSADNNSKSDRNNSTNVNFKNDPVQAVDGILNVSNPKEGAYNDWYNWYATYGYNLYYYQQYASYYDASFGATPYHIPPPQGNIPKVGGGNTTAGASADTSTGTSGYLATNTTKEATKETTKETTKGMAHHASVRTVYIGNLPDDVKVHEVLDFITTGNVEQAKLIPQKNCAFITFVDAKAAVVFHRKAIEKKLSLRDKELKLGWGKSTSTPSHIQEAIESGATRCIFIGSVDASITEEQLAQDFSGFGTVDRIKIHRKKSIAFVHLASIACAVKAVATLSLDSRYCNRKVKYARDPCAKFADFEVHMARRQLALSTDGKEGASGGISLDILTAEGRRCVYLGGIWEETTCEDLCSAIRGGMLSKIEYHRSKKYAFVTFVDPDAAKRFLDRATDPGLKVKGRLLKVNWGKDVLNLPVDVIQALRFGATRNVYVGGIEGVADEQKLKSDFEEYGEIEKINVIKEKNCGFINFTNVLSAAKAVKGIESRPEYAEVKVGYGRDRCGNLQQHNDPENVVSRSNGTAKSEDAKKSTDTGKSKGATKTPANSTVTAVNAGTTTTATAGPPSISDHAVDSDDDDMDLGP
ncbi:hypothetical protein BG011_004918 [Mortierella polycephala]|uniref:RRM domain-containing protein n=1 Tax=Mortierella polycephala TaxID=41804 RepID=A0A9P6PXF5_9FUNG|nr:hypothetical protein BG011_004918 [Mortierella polycephala]